MRIRASVLNACLATILVGIFLVQGCSRNSIDHQTEAVNAGVKCAGFEFENLRGFEEDLDLGHLMNAELNVMIKPSWERGAQFHEKSNEMSEYALKQIGIDLESRETVLQGGRQKLVLKGTRQGTSEGVCIVLTETRQGCAQLMLMYPNDLGKSQQEEYVDLVEHAIFVDD